MTEARSRSRKKKRTLGILFRLLLFCVLIILSWNTFGRKLAEPYLPSSERKDPCEWFDVSGNDVRLYVNDAFEKKVLAVSYKGGVYLPLKWVEEKITDDFFYSASERLLTHTEPDEVLDMDESCEFDGKKAFILKAGDPYILLELLERYSDISSRSFAGNGETARRVFIYRGGYGTKYTGTVRKSVLRTSPDRRSPILTDIPEGDRVFVLDKDEKWTKLSTSDGFIGYAENRAVSEAVTDYTYPHTYKPLAAEFRGLDEKLVMGWHMVSGHKGNSYFEKLYENTGGVINAISPTWIQISDADGNYVNYSDGEYVRKAHEKGLKVYACVDNFNQPGGYRDFSTGSYFSLSENRKDFIDRLMKDAEEYGYDGFNLDFEGIPSEAGAAYSEFFKELSVACHNRDLALSIDDPVPFAYNEFYDLADQGRFADYVIIMCYDEHTAATDAGSVASLSYTFYGIQEALRSVPDNRLVAGIPFYTRMWLETPGGVSSENLSMKEAAEKLKEYKMETEWDETAGQNYAEKKVKDGIRMIWMEDERSLREKLRIVKEEDIAGISAWRLGNEPAEIWPVLDLNAGK